MKKNPVKKKQQKLKPKSVPNKPKRPSKSSATSSAVRTDSQPLQDPADISPGEEETQRPVRSVTRSGTQSNAVTNTSDSSDSGSGGRNDIEDDNGDKEDYVPDHSPSPPRNRVTSRARAMTETNKKSTLVTPVPEEKRDTVVEVPSDDDVEIVPSDPSNDNACTGRKEEPRKRTHEQAKLPIIDEEIRKKRQSETGSKEHDMPVPVQAAHNSTPIAPSGTLVRLVSKVDTLATSVGVLSKSVRTLQEQLAEGFNFLKVALNTMDTKSVASTQEPSVRDGKPKRGKKKFAVVKTEVPQGMEDNLAPIDAYEVRMFHKLPSLDTVYSVKPSQICIAKCIIIELVRVINKTEMKTLTPSGLLSVMTMVTTPPKRGKAEKELKQKVDEFFRNLVVSCIQMSRENSLLMFSDGYPVVEEKKGTEEDVTDTTHDKNTSPDVTQPTSDRNVGEADIGTEEKLELQEPASGTKQNQQNSVNGGHKSVTADGVVVVENDPRDVRPFWVLQHKSTEQSTITYIERKHVIEAQLFDQGVTKKQMYDKRADIGVGREQPGRDELAFFACKYGFSFFTHVTNENRKSISRAFFRDVGYLFDDWKIPEQQYGIGKGTLKVYFPSPFVSSEAVKITEVPTATVYTVGDMNSNEGNIVAYDKFRAERSELKMLVEHQVLVNMGKADAKRVHTGRKKDLYTHGVHLMDVAVRLLAACSGIPHKDKKDTDILGASKYSIAILYHLGIVLRKILTGREIDVAEGVTERLKAHERDDLGEVDHSVLDKLLYILRPGATDRFSVFKQIIGSVPWNEYKTDNLPDNADAEAQAKTAVVLALDEEKLEI